MKRSILVIAMVLLGIGVSSAQSPDKVFGFGVTAGQSLGGHILYAITPAVHVGTGFGLALQSSNGTSTNQVYFAPYGKFLLSGTKEFKPFILGQFMISSGPSGNSASNTTSTSLNFGVGGEYFITPRFGIQGMFHVIQIGFDPSFTAFGFLTPAVGVEWFMD
ncbi:MAG: hypothetical protein JSS89_04690 [Bacteroidetes bacterium]|nr:hypothetical protein [Bacteroidota bacterium]